MPVSKILAAEFTIKVFYEDGKEPDGLEDTLDQLQRNIEYHSKQPFAQMEGVSVEIEEG